MQGTIADYAVIVNNVLKYIAPKVAPTTRSEYLDFMYKVEDNQRIYSDTGVTGLGMAEIIPDGFLFESPAAKIKGEVKSKVLEGKNAIELAKNYLAQCLLAQGFGTSFTWVPINQVGTPTPISTLGADAVAYWSASHPREDGGPVWTNVIVDIVPSPQFTYSSLLAARRQQSLKKDGRGMPLMSTLDTLVARTGSITAQFATTIKGTIDKGLAPQQVNLFNNAPATDTFKVVTLSPFENQGLTGLMWGMFDSKMQGQDYGFMYIEALATRAEPAVIDLLGNQDLVLNFNSLAQMGASDLRSWMWSAGDGTSAG